MRKVSWNTAPQWADQFGYIGLNNYPAWSNKHQYEFTTVVHNPVCSYDDSNPSEWSYSDFKLAESRPDVVITQSSELLPDETYTIRLDSDSMNEAVVKFLVILYKDNHVFDQGSIHNSILQVIEYCTTVSEYDSILAELGIE